MAAVEEEDSDVNSMNIEAEVVERKGPQLYVNMAWK